MGCHQVNQSQRTHSRFYLRSNQTYIRFRFIFQLSSHFSESQLSSPHAPNLGPTCSRQNAPPSSSASYSFRTRFPRRPTRSASFPGTAVASRRHPSITVIALPVCTPNRLITNSGGRHIDPCRSCTLQTLLSVASTSMPPLFTLFTHSLYSIYIYIYIYLIAHSTLAFPLQHSFHSKPTFLVEGMSCVVTGHKTTDGPNRLIRNVYRCYNLTQQSPTDG